MLYPNRIKIVIIYRNFFNNHDFFSIKLLQVFEKYQKGAGVGNAIRNFGSGSRRQFNFGSSALGSATLLETGNR